MTRASTLSLRLFSFPVLLGLGVGLCLGVGACDAYDPDLGDRPFRCEPADPARPDRQRCPEGYHPVAVAAPIFCECQRNGSDGSGGGGGGGDADAAPNPQFSCNDDPFEGTNGNETITYATPTTLCTSASTVEFTRLAICPTTDADTFLMDVDTTGKMLTARIRYAQGDGEIMLSILNSGGSQVASAIVQTDQAVATFQVPAAGRYYAQVRAGASGSRNNYEIQLATD